MRGTAAPMAMARAITATKAPAGRRTPEPTLLTGPDGTGTRRCRPSRALPRGEEPVFSGEGVRSARLLSALWRPTVAVEREHHLQCRRGASGRTRRRRFRPGSGSPSLEPTPSEVPTAKDAYYCGRLAHHVLLQAPPHRHDADGT